MFLKPLLMFFLISGILSALNSAAAEDKAAMEAFQQGTDLHKQDRFAEAADAFTRAYTLRPSWKIQYNIAQCRAAAKQYGLALEAFEAYLVKGGDDVPVEKRKSVAEEIRTLKEMVGYLTLEAEADAEIFVDGKPRGSTPLTGSIAVAAGVNHDVEVRLQGDTLVRKTVRVNSGITLAVEASPDDKPKGTSRAPSGGSSETDVDTDSDTDADTEPVVNDKGSGAKGLRIAGWTTTGIGLGAGVGGLVTGLMALSINQDLEKKTCIGNACDGDNEKMRQFQVSTNVLLGVGGTLTVAGVTMLIVSLVKRKRETKDVSLIPVVAPGSYCLTFQRKF